MEKEPMERKILHMDPSDMTNLSYDCSCGRHHAIRIGELLIGRVREGETVIDRDDGSYKSEQLSLF